jgi:hypothetical protein
MKIFPIEFICGLGFLFRLLWHSGLNLAPYASQANALPLRYTLSSFQAIIIDQVKVFRDKNLCHSM